VSCSPGKACQRCLGSAADRRASENPEKEELVTAEPRTRSMKGKKRMASLERRLAGPKASAC
jgi:hypothetical protein